jgi:hypothetical protein
VEGDGQRVVNPPADLVLPLRGKILLIGSLDAEEQFLKKFKPKLNHV